MAYDIYTFRDHAEYLAKQHSALSKKLRVTKARIQRLRRSQAHATRKNRARITQMLKYYAAMEHNLELKLASLVRQRLTND